MKPAWPSPWRSRSRPNWSRRSARYARPAACGASRRADSAGMRGIAVPVLEGALDRSLQLATSMDARGYGRRCDTGERCPHARHRSHGGRPPAGGRRRVRSHRRWLGVRAGSAPAGGCRTVVRSRVCRPGAATPEIALSTGSLGCGGMAHRGFGSGGTRLHDSRPRTPGSRHGRVLRASGRTAAPPAPGRRHPGGRSSGVRGARQQRSSAHRLGESSKRWWPRDPLRTRLLLLSGVH